MSQDPFALLKAEVDLLGRLLGEAIRTLSGERFFVLVEEVRALAKARRQGDEAAGEALLARVEGLSTEEGEALVRAFTHYFHLVNRAEELAERVIFDGFPRTLAQAEALDRLLAETGTRLLGVVLVEVPEEELVRRILKRAELEGRSDDNEETVRRRLEVYREKTEPLVGYYEARGVLKRVDGLGTPDEVYARIRAALGI